MLPYHARKGDTMIRTVDVQKAIEEGIDNVSFKGRKILSFGKFSPYAGSGLIYFAHGKSEAVNLSTTLEVN